MVYHLYYNSNNNYLLQKYTKSFEKTTFWLSILHPEDFILFLIYKHFLKYKHYSSKYPSIIQQSFWVFFSEHTLFEQTFKYYTIILQICKKSLYKQKFILFLKGNMTICQQGSTWSEQVSFVIVSNRAFFRYLDSFQSMNELSGKLQLLLFLFPDNHEWKTEKCQWRFSLQLILRTEMIFLG